MTKFGGEEHIGVGKLLASWETADTSTAKVKGISFRKVTGPRNPFRFQGTETPTQNDLNNKEVFLSHIRCAVNSVAQQCHQSPSLLPSFYSEALNVSDMSSELLCPRSQEGWCNSKHHTKIQQPLGTVGNNRRKGRHFPSRSPLKSMSPLSQKSPADLALMSLWPGFGSSPLLNQTLARRIESSWLMQTIQDSLLSHIREGWTPKSRLSHKQRGTTVIYLVSYKNNGKWALCLLTLGTEYI